MIKIEKISLPLFFDQHVYIRPEDQPVLSISDTMDAKIYIVSTTVKEGSEAHSLLLNVLQAVNLQLSEIVFVPTMALDDTVSGANNSTFIVFQDAPFAYAPHYTQKQDPNGNTWIVAHALQTLLHDREKKVALWQVMKVVFMPTTQ